MKKNIVITTVLLIGLFIFGSCGKGGKKSVEQEVTKGGFTFLFYADTRGDPRFTNWFQSLHKKFIAKILKNEKESGIRHLVFGGDNVWLGFFNPSWKLFFKVMKVYEDRQIKIYPAIGNHELWLSRFGFAVLKIFRKKAAVKDAGTLDVLDQLIQKKVKKDELKRLLADKDFMEKLVNVLETETAHPSFEAEHKAFLEKLEKEYSETPTDIFKEIADIYYIAQEVSHHMILAAKAKKGAPSTNWQRFRKYVDAWPHLKEIGEIKNEQSYYSFKLPDENNAKIKIIILDSNPSMIDDAGLKEWFNKEISAKFDGPVLVACHHPIFYDSGWFREKFGANWKFPPHLVLVGHVHDYERLSKTQEGNTSPIYIISGSGGAYLESGGPHCKGDNTRVHKKWYNYTRITVTEDKIHLKVFGCKKMSDPLTRIDEIEFKWK